MHPHLRPLLKHCCHCGIYFLTHSRNAGRSDLRCPFGCREAHQKKESTRRSVEYYQTPEGKFKKKLINDRRGQGKRTDEKHQQREESRETNISIVEIVPYLQTVASLLEGRRVSADEILEVLNRKMRQHSMFIPGERGYIGPYYEEDPL